MFNHKGFTLIEIIIALFIFSIISILMMNGLHIVFNAQSATEKKSQRMSEMQFAFILMSRDFEQPISRSISNREGKEINAFIGKENAVEFTRAGFANPLGQLQRPTLQRVQYRLSKNNLQRITWPALDRTEKTKAEARTILTQVKKLQFEYLDKEGKFQKTWDQDKNFPRAVRVMITLNDLTTVSALYVK